MENIILLYLYSLMNMFIIRNIPEQKYRADINLLLLSDSVTELAYKFNAEINHAPHGYHH